MIRKEVCFEVTADEVGEELANASDFDQAQFLLSLAHAVDLFPAGGWPVQCRRACEHFSSAEAAHVKSALGVLMDHLDEREKAK